MFKLSMSQQRRSIEQISSYQNLLSSFFLSLEFLESSFFGHRPVCFLFKPEQQSDLRVRPLGPNVSRQYYLPQLFWLF